MVIEGLKNYDISFEEETLKDVLDPILTSYFYLQRIKATDMYVDFIHKTFREYFLAEYYLESILNNKEHYLNVGIPSPETISFLDGLLELLLEDKNENLKEHANILTKSLVDNLSQSGVTQTLSKNARGYYEEEKIIFQTEHYESNKIWFIADFRRSKYAELWIQRWLSLYVLNKIAPGTYDNNSLADFIGKTSHTVPQLSMTLNKVHLSDQFLGHTLLIGADLSGADLSGAYLYRADLSGANLSGADLSRADLSDAYLSRANLSDAYLSRANLSGANLSGANLSGANLPRADLSRADLSRANLSGADRYTSLSSADLHYADLSGADLSGADLSGADLSGADLSGANLSGANLSVSDASLTPANLSGANLSGANLSGANLSDAYLPRADLSGANLSNAYLSRANLSGANLFDVKTDDRTNFENTPMQCTPSIVFKISS